MNVSPFPPARAALPPGFRHGRRQMRLAMAIAVADLPGIAFEMTGEAGEQRPTCPKPLSPTMPITSPGQSMKDTWAQPMRLP